MFRYSDVHSKNLPRCIFVEPSIQGLDLRDHDVWLTTYEKHNKIRAWWVLLLQRAARFVHKHVLTVNTSNLYRWLFGEGKM